MDKGQTKGKNRYIEISITYSAMYFSAENDIKRTIKEGTNGTKQGGKVQ